MNTSEYLLIEYKALTDRYTTASRHLKELLYPISALPADEKPDFKAIKEILLELHKLEDVLEYVTGRLRNVFHQLMMLIKEEDLAKEDKLKKKATQAPKTKRTAKATKPAKVGASPKKVKKVKKEEKEK